MGFTKTSIDSKIVRKNLERFSRETSFAYNRLNRQRPDALRRAATLGAVCVEALGRPLGELF